MSDKIVMKFDTFKLATSNGALKETAQFLANQRIGKVEFTTKPWNFNDQLKSLPQSYKDKYGGDKVTKWVVDIENGKFVKLVNGKVDYQENVSVGGAISEIQDLIKSNDKNDYSSVTIFRRKSIPGKNPDKFKLEVKQVKKQSILERLIRKVIKEELTKKSKRKLNEERLPSDPVESYLRSALWTSEDDEGNPLDDTMGLDSINSETRNKAKQDVNAFIMKLKKEGLYPAYINAYGGEREAYSQLGHDFWLTRNGHGAGFWDRSELDEDGLGDKISKIAKSFGGSDMYIGDDGDVYLQ